MKPTRTLKPKPDNWLHRAVKFYNSGKYAQAERIAREAFARAPADAANLLAGIALKRGDRAAARKYLERALRAAPAALAIRSNLARLLREMGDHPAALAEFERIAAAAPKDAGAQADLARAFLDLGRTEDAVAAYRASVALKPSAEASGGLASALVSLGRDSEALDSAREAVAQGRDTPDIHCILGRCLLDARDYAPAAAAFERALDLDPDTADALIGLSVARSRLRDPIAARIATRRFLSLRPSISTGARDADLHVTVTQALFSGVIRTPEFGTALFRTGNFPSYLNCEGVRFEHVLVDLTDGSQSFDLKQPDIVLNNLVNAEYLEDPATLAIAERACAAFGREVINRPGPAARTSRQSTHDRFHACDGFVVPRTVTCEAMGADREALTERIIAEVGLPAIIRPPNMQLGANAELIRDADALRRHVRAVTYPRLCAIRYYNCSDARGNARQYRIVALDGRLYPERLNVAPYWHSHSGDREALGWYENGYGDLERRYIEDPAETLGADPATVFAPFLERLGLDIFGIDFGVDDQGRIIVFEANASMNLFNRKYDAFAPYKTESCDAFERRVRDYLLRRAGKTA